jgi:hypothetical protein
METKYYDLANMFSVKKTVETAPDFKGDAELSEQLCAYIVDTVKAGGTPKISLSAWVKQGKYGEFLGCRISQSFGRDAPTSKPASKFSSRDKNDDSDIPF